MLCLALAYFRIRFSALMRAPTLGIHCEPRYQRALRAKTEVSTVKGYIEPSLYQSVVIVEQVKHSGALRDQPPPSDDSACKHIIALRPRHHDLRLRRDKQLCFQISDNYLNLSEYISILFRYPT